MKVVENKQKENDIELKINAVCGAGCWSKDIKVEGRDKSMKVIENKEQSEEDFDMKFNVLSG